VVTLPSGGGDACPSLLETTGVACDLTSPCGTQQCDNALKDDVESDVDCGADSGCRSCGEGARCATSRDCGVGLLCSVSFVCVGKSMCDAAKRTRSQCFVVHSHRMCACVGAGEVPDNADEYVSSSMVLTGVTKLQVFSNPAVLQQLKQALVDQFSFLGATVDASQISVTDVVDAPGRRLQAGSGGAVSISYVVYTPPSVSTSTITDAMR
jgi:hypothetical protein